MATLTTIGSRKHMDADSQARLIFDRMADDFATMAAAPGRGLHILQKCNWGDGGECDAMFFYSEAPAYANVSGNQSTVSPGYRINSTTFQLERLGEALTWDTATSNDASSLMTSNTTPGGVVFLTYDEGQRLPPPASLDGN